MHEGREGFAGLTPAWLIMVVRWAGAWWMVGWLALGGLTGLEEAGDAEAGVGCLEEGNPVGYEPVSVLLAR
jgi:hypothetical protein